MDTATQALIIGLLVEMRLQIRATRKQLHKHENRIDEIEARSKLPAIVCGLAYFGLMITIHA